MNKNKTPDIGDVVILQIGGKEVYGTVVCRYANGEWGAIIPNGFISQGSILKHKFTGKSLSLSPIYRTLERIGQYE